jgi:hypothetical protein
MEKNMHDLSYKYLSEALSVEQEGKLLLSFGFNMTVYFEQGHTRSQTEGSFGCFQ